MICCPTWCLTPTLLNQIRTVALLVRDRFHLAPLLLLCVEVSHPLRNELQDGEQEHQIEENGYQLAERGGVIFRVDAVYSEFEPSGEGMSVIAK